MSDSRRPNEGDEELSPDDIRRLQAWAPRVPPDGFTARVLGRARAQRAEAARPAPAEAPRPIAAPPPLTRAELDRRRRRRAALATLLGAGALAAGGGFVAWQAGVSAAQATTSVMTVYLAALAFGGVLLLASLLGGHGHADHDTGDHDHGDDFHHGDHHGTETHTAAHTTLVLPFLSLRFWIFGLTFFGLTGAILHGLGLAGPATTAVIASVLGLGTGYGAAQLFQSLARQTVGEIAADGGHIGREGRLLLPTARGQRGKLRVVANAVTMDFLAETDDEILLPAGTPVLIVGMRGNVAVVERSPAPTEPTD
jgi:hypothetical protein